MGFEPQQPHSTLESANEFTERIALGIEEAKAALTKAKDKYTMYYNHQYGPAPVFTPGDKVWLDGSDIATCRSLAKDGIRRHWRQLDHREDGVKAAELGGQS
jgi:hypothetical protein